MARIVGRVLCRYGRIGGCEFVEMLVLWREHLCVEYNRVFGGADGVGICAQ